MSRFGQQMCTLVAYTLLSHRARSRSVLAAHGNARIRVATWRAEHVRADSLLQSLAATAVFGCRSELWCNSTDEGPSPHSREVSMPDRIASIDDYSTTLGRGLLAKFSAKWLCHDATGCAAASACTGAPRRNGSGADMSVLR